MNALEVLYAPTLWRFAAVEPCAPVVRYADHCAEVEKLKAELERKEQLRANAVARCDEWQKEAHRLAMLLAAHPAFSVRVAPQTGLHVHGGDTGHALPEQPIVTSAGRWDTLPKAL